jgi:beta-glucanase (GH16 family)
MLKIIISSILFITSALANINQTCISISGFQNSTVNYNPNNIREENGFLNMYLTQDTGGSGIIYGQPIHYGEINIVMKTSEGNNVVTAFYLRSQNGDEMVRNKTDFNRVIQTTFYYREIPLYEVNARYYISNNILLQNFNKYTIVWMPDYYEWKLNDIVIMRTTRNDTNTYPDSISSIYLTIWEAKPSRWAGPGINWNQQPFMMSIKSISINCNNENLSYFRNIDTRKIYNNYSGVIYPYIFMNYILMFVIIINM